MLVLVFSLTNRVWPGILGAGHSDDVQPDEGVGVEGCRLFRSAPGPLRFREQNCEERRERGVILALQACTTVFVGVDDQNVDNHLGNLGPEICCRVFLTFCGLGDGAPCRSAKIRDMPRRVWWPVGGCGELILNRADEAAAFGRRRQDDWVATDGQIHLTRHFSHAVHTS